MQSRAIPASSTWFSSLVGLLVALGTQTFLDAVIPANAINVGSGYFVVSQSLWIGDIVIRILSYIFGGFVGALLARSLSTRLIAMLLIAALIPTFFAQLPEKASMPWIVAWGISAPLGIVLGAWLASLRRGIN